MLKHFNYHLTGAGWAEAWFVGEFHKVNFELSYLNDSLLDLLDGLASLKDGTKTELEIVFAEEPGSIA